MTLDKAIKHAEEVIVEMSYEFQESVALQDHKNAKLCRECAEEHRQLAEWLKDYKRLKEQEPKTGYWRPIHQGDEIIDYRCSECEFGSTFGKSTGGMNYCPYCGAKMEREDKK